MAPVAAVFSGALAPKKKSELQEIATALRISEQGTKEEIQNRIKKHLDNNPDLEDDAKFAGLYGRRRRSVQPPVIATSLEKPRSSARFAPLDPVRESTPPTPDTKGISKLPSSAIPQIDDMPIPTPLPSPSKSVIQVFPKPAEIKAAVERFQAREIIPHGIQYLEATRALLSSSQNIWTLTALYELLYILYTVIPWKAAELPLSPKANGASVSLPYPPLSTFSTSTFWVVLLHWALPTLVIPGLAGYFISFTPPASSTPDSRPSTAPSDPLTTAIVRLAASLAYPYARFSAAEHIYGLDVIGYNSRVFNASLGLAFAFAEAISTAPKSFARALAEEQKLAIAPVESTELVVSERLSEEVD